MRGGAVGPFFSCVRHAARAEVPGRRRTGARYGRGERCGAEAGVSGREGATGAGEAEARGRERC
eukprot:scaffold32362_cov50-Phaeocystis_antarctica.AAC.5